MTILEESLRAWGWRDRYCDDVAAEAAAGRVPARVIAQHRGEYRIVSPFGDAIGVAPGRMLYRASGQRELPAVGDWVLIDPPTDGPATILEILPRSTQFVRRRAGTEGQEQVVAANVDTAFVMSSLNLELNLRRLERYLVATWESGAQPVILLSKADLIDDAADALERVEQIASGAPVHAISSATGEGLDELQPYLQPGSTVVLLGSSGVGKSTLVNKLAGEDFLRTQEVRDADHKGRHTTTHREIFRLPGGALLLDTPGMRELGLVEAEEGLDEAFDDVAALVDGCRFRDCRHDEEPGCAVRAALEAGELAPERWISYEKLQKESAYEDRRRDVAAALEEKRRWKRIHKAMRKHPTKKR